MRDLIQIEQKNIIECNTKECDFSIPYSKDKEERLWKYLNTKCPKCSSNLLTVGEYKFYTRLMRNVRFINKWFSWLTVFQGWWIKKPKRKMEVILNKV